MRPPALIMCVTATCCSCQQVVLKQITASALKNRELVKCHEIGIPQSKTTPTLNTKFSSSCRR